MTKKGLPDLTGLTVLSGLPDLTGYPIMEDVTDYVTFKFNNIPAFTNIIKYDAKIENDTLVLEVDKHAYKERIEVPLKDIFDYLKKEVLK